MKKFAAATVLMFLSSTCALAADLAPQPVEPVAPVVTAYDWTGLYLGADAGYSWGKSTWNNTRVNSEYFDYDPDGGVVGGHVGYNYQFDGGVVAGAEIDANGTWIKSDDIALQIPSGGVNAGYRGNSDVKFQGSARLRLGYAFDRFLPYVTGGAALADYDYGWNSNRPASYSQSDTRVGWTIGAGLEYAVTDHWTVRAQYLYADYGTKTHGDYSDDQGNTGYARYKVDLSTNTVTAGISYKF